MCNYQIITDSGCDFPAEMYDALGVTCVPLTVSFRGQTFPDRNDDSLKELYAGLSAGEVATTSAVNPDGWAGALRPVLEAGRDVLVLAFSSGLSATCQSARIAAEELAEQFPERKILVCDTLCASLGQGLLVWYACRRQKDGHTLDELYSWVEDNKYHLCHWFTVDDLMYLKRGGRIGAATAIVGTVLNIKPVLHVDDEGHLVNVGKERGRKASILALAKKVQELGEGYENPVFYISHGDCLDDAEFLAQTLRDKYNAREVYINYVGAVIGSHSGPGTLALFFMGSHR